MDHHVPSVNSDQTPQTPQTPLPTAANPFTELSQNLANLAAQVARQHQDFSVLKGFVEALAKNQQAAPAPAPAPAPVLDEARIRAIAGAEVELRIGNLDRRIKDEVGAEMVNLKVDLHRYTDKELDRRLEQLRSMVAQEGQHPGFWDSAVQGSGFLFPIALGGGAAYAVKKIFF
jgi:hypothetical protein